MKAHPRIDFTCFFCSHKVRNGKYRLIKFKKVIKKVCFNCSPHTHSCLKIKNRESNTECRICNYATKNNDCLKCDICDHMTHAKCNNLNKVDVNLIINKNYSFTCQNCCNELFPRDVDLFNDISRNKRKVKSNSTMCSKDKQCFVCPNKLNARMRYWHKIIIYNGDRVEICKDCSHKNFLPVKNQDLLEFIECSSCLKSVHNEGIFCEICKSWNHPQCYNIDRKTLKDLNDSNIDWYCGNCLKDTLPMFDADPIDYLANTKSVEMEYIIRDDCSICTKIVKTSNSISCSLCRHWIHKKCIGTFSKGTQSFADFLNYYKNVDWFCSTCLAETFPFHQSWINMNDTEFQLQCFETSHDITIETDILKSLYTITIYKYVFQNSTFGR